MRVKLQFCYKGERNYVHGTDIFNVVYNFYQQYTNQVPSHIEMSMHQIAHNNMTLVINEGLLLTETATVNFNFSLEGQNIMMSLIENEDQIECRYEYAEDSIIKVAHFSELNKNIILPSFNQYTFIEKVVALNKGLLHALFPEIKGKKWYFVKIKLNQFDFLEKNNQEIELRFKKNMNFKLTQTEIIAENKLIGNIYFSLV